MDLIFFIKEDLDIEEAFKKKLEFICSFCNTSCEIKKVSIRTIEKTNLSYVESLEKKILWRYYEKIVFRNRWIV